MIRSTFGFSGSCLIFLSLCWLVLTSMSMLVPISCCCCCSSCFGHTSFSSSLFGAFFCPVVGWFCLPQLAKRKERRKVKGLPDELAKVKKWIKCFFFFYLLPHIPRAQNQRRRLLENTDLSCVLKRRISMWSITFLQHTHFSFFDCSLFIYFYL